MATAISTIKSWFVTNAKPTQSQFWAWIDSFRHKDEKVPVADVEGLNTVLLPFNTHLNDANAHSALFVKAKIYPIGQLQIFKTNTEGNPAILEVGDFVIGIVSGQFIRGIYLGGDITNIESFNVIDYIEF